MHATRSRLRGFQGVRSLRNYAVIMQYGSHSFYAVVHVLGSFGAPEVVARHGSLTLYAVVVAIGSLDSCAVFRTSGSLSFSVVVNTIGSLYVEAVSVLSVRSFTMRWSARAAPLSVARFSHSTGSSRGTRWVKPRLTGAGDAA